VSVGRATPRGLSQVTYDDNENEKEKNDHFMSRRRAHERTTSAQKELNFVGGVWNFKWWLITFKCNLKFVTITHCAPAASSLRYVT